MPDDISFEHPDWTAVAEIPDQCEKAWINSPGVIISLHHLGLDKGLRSHLGDPDSVRNYYRTSFASNGLGLIECDLLEIEGVPAVRAIAKIIQRPAGASYVGTIAMPLPRESYVFNVAAREVGITGVRETALNLKIGSELEQQGFALDLPPEDQAVSSNTPIRWKHNSTGAIVRWAEDPYDPEYEGPCLRNMADAPEHDGDFPLHPLSQVRAAIECLAQEIRLSPDLKKRAEGKKRWGFW